LCDLFTQKASKERSERYNNYMVLRVNGKIPVLVIALETPSGQFELAKNRILSQKIAPNIGDLEVTEYGYPPSIENVDFSTGVAKEQIDEEYLPALERGYLLIDGESLPNTRAAIEKEIDAKLGEAAKARFIAINTFSRN